MIEATQLLESIPVQEQLRSLLLRARRSTGHDAPRVREAHGGDHQREMLDGEKAERRVAHRRTEVLQRFGGERAEDEIEQEPEQHLRVERIAGLQCRQSDMSAWRLTGTPRRQHVAFQRAGDAPNNDMRVTQVSLREYGENVAISIASREIDVADQTGHQTGSIEADPRVGFGERKTSDR